MNLKFSVAKLIVGVLLSFCAAQASTAETIALPESPDRVVLKPGECASTVTGEHRLRWFCADVPGSSAVDTNSISEQLVRAQSTISDLFAEKAQLTQLLAEARGELAEARDANQQLRDLTMTNIDEAKSSLSRFEQKLTESQRALTAALESNQNLQARLSASEEQAREATSRLAALSGDVTSCRELLGDRDRDGIPDSIDLCADSAAGQAVDRTGCSANEAWVLQGITFDWNSTRLTADSRRLLDKLADQLNSFPDLEFEIAGHTDGTGNAEANRRISMLRAQAVRDYLLARGISNTRLVAKGYGMDQPIADNSSAAGRAQNRRVTLSRLN